MYTIGQFSTIVRISARMLRHYDDIGLLKPICVDEDTKYRYYSPEQVTIAYKIFLLRELNFPLKEIDQILLKIVRNEDITELIRSHQKRIQDNIEHEQSLLRKISRLLEPQMEVLFMKNKIEEKQVDKMLLATIRRTGKYEIIKDMLGELFGKVGHLCVGAPVCFYYDNEYKPDGADIEAALPVKQKIDVQGLNFKEVPSTKVASIKHIGPYEDVGSTYKVLFDYVNDKGLEITGHCREVYLTDPAETSPEEYVTDVQIPIS